MSTRSGYNTFVHSFFRKGGSNLLIKILYRNSRYGFVEPCEFSSVQSLVRYFKTHSLEEYNPALRTLQTPLTRTVSFCPLLLHVIARCQRADYMASQDNWEPLSSVSPSDLLVCLIYMSKIL